MNQHAGEVAAPMLSVSEIEREVQRIFSKDRSSRLVALYGRGEAGSIAAHGYAFEVIPTRSELELRSRMPSPARVHNPGKVFLIDWTDQPLPQDLACRMAGRRMFPITSEARLASLFGARTVEPELVSTALAKVLLAGEVTGLGKTAGQVLRRQEAYRRFMHARLGFPLDGDLTPERIGIWAVTNDKGPAFTKQCEPVGLWQTVQDEMGFLMSVQVGSFGSAAWLAWEANHGQRFIELCLVLEAAAAELNTGSYVDGLLRGKADTLAPLWGASLIGGWSSDRAVRVSAFLDQVLAELEPERAKAIYSKADSLIDDPLLRKLLARSHRLPSGYEHCRARFATVLKAVAQSPSRNTFDRARRAYEKLEGHRMSRDEAEGIRAQRLMALRLAAYVTHHSLGAQSVGPTGAEYEAVYDLSDFYVTQGGFIDWARQRVRSSSEPGIRHIVEVVDNLRREQDKRFAQALVSWNAAGKPSQHVLPIADVSKQVIGEFLSENGRRKLLVILLDGMSWANAVELLHSAARESDRWGLASWRPKRHRSRDAGMLPPVISSVPTITTVSRAAFFAGKEALVHGNEGTSKDPERWANNAALSKFFRPGQSPVLLLKDDLTTQSGPTVEVRDAIMSSDRVVALVINAIDEQLKGSKQLWVECTVDHIRPLRDILGHAASAERAVLLIADHGHVPGDVLKSKGKADGHARWRALKPGEVAAEFEVALPAAGWKPKGAAGIAAIWDESVCYGTPAYGEHGGLSMAEVVAPALLLAPENLAELDGNLDEGLRVTRFREPDWWSLKPPAEKPAPAQPASIKPPKPTPQLPLFVAPAEPAPEPKPSRPELVGSLAAAPAFKAHVKHRPAERVKDALHALSAVVNAGDRIAAAELTMQCNVPHYQLAGLVARMAEVLNAEGYPVIEYDREGKQVSLNRAMLVQVFEVSC